MSALQNYSVKNDPRFDTAQWNQAIGPLPTAIDESPMVFLDTVNGSDANDGINGAVASFEKAVDIANGYDNATIDILSSSVSLGAAPTYRARNTITVTGDVTTDLTSSVVTATPEATYATNTVITVADTLVASALSGKVLTFTSGSFIGQSFNIITNAVSSITIAGNVAAAAADTFTVVTPNTSLVQNSGDVTWVGRWNFTNIIVGTTALSWIAECDSCIVLTGSTVDAVLDSNKHSFVVIDACNVIQDITTEFSDSWLIKNSVLDSITVTWLNSDNLMQNVYFTDVTLTLDQATLRIENSTWEGDALNITNSSRASLTNFVADHTAGGSFGIYSNGSLIELDGNILVQGNYTLDGIVSDINSVIHGTSPAIIIDNSGTGRNAINAEQFGAIAIVGGTIDIQGDYTRAISGASSGNIKLDDLTLTFDAGTYSDGIQMSDGSTLSCRSTTFLSSGATVSTSWFFILNANMDVSTVTFTLTGTCVNGFSFSDGSNARMRNVSFNLPSCTGNAINVDTGSNVYINALPASILTGAVDGIFVARGSSLNLVNGQNLTLTATAGDGVTSTLTSRVITFGLTTAQITAGGTEYVVAAMSGAYPAAPAFIDDFAGTDGSSLSVQ